MSSSKAEFPTFLNILLFASSKQSQIRTYILQCANVIPSFSMKNGTNCHKKYKLCPWNIEFMLANTLFLTFHQKDSRLLVPVVLAWPLSPCSQQSGLVPPFTSLRPMANYNEECLAGLFVNWWLMWKHFWSIKHKSMNIYKKNKYKREIQICWKDKTD